MHLLWVLPLTALIAVLIWVFFYTVRANVRAGERCQGRCLRDDDPDGGDYTDER